MPDAIKADMARIMQEVRGVGLGGFGSFKLAREEYWVGHVGTRPTGSSFF
ncbi:hypothetical protein [Telluribacter humicola]|nr:hypothetical protein [Telluribacter humicola]